VQSEGRTMTKTMFKGLGSEYLNLRNPTLNPTGLMYAEDYGGRVFCNGLVTKNSLPGVTCRELFVANKKLQELYPI